MDENKCCWGRVTHICVGKLTIIGSDNGLSPGRRQAIIWTNDGILLIGALETNFSEILIEIQTFSCWKKLFESVVCEMAAILSHELKTQQWINSLPCIFLFMFKVKSCSHWCSWILRKPIEDQTNCNWTWLIFISYILKWIWKVFWEMQFTVHFLSVWRFDWNIWWLWWGSTAFCSRK